MKFRLILLTLLLVSTLALSSCGSDEVKPEVREYIMFTLPNGELIEAEPESYTRWSNSCMEITIEGVTYSVHPSRVAIISKREGK